MATLTMMVAGDDEQLQSLIAAGLQRIELAATARSEEIVTAIDTFLEQCGPTLEQRAAEVALVFGEQLCRTQNWGWAAYQEEEATFEYSLVAGDRSLWLRPETLVEQILGDESQEGVRLIDVYRAIVDGRISAEPNDLSEIC